MSIVPTMPAVLRKPLTVLAAAVALTAVATAITVPLDLNAQLAFGATTIAAAFVLDRVKGMRVTIALAILSVVVSTRYIWWRTTETLSFRTLPEAAFGFGLYMAELYAWLILLLGYFQTTWPLHRPVYPIAGEPEAWPSVDVFVPTYNESLQIVQDTVLAAMAMDYPRDRFRVFILDDGRRDEFRAFAEEAGCEYMIRPDNKHAKAGNLNHALTKTDGELCVVFDADHIPTRAFLQMTVGWFQRDTRLALLQTPHHFYSPDPVQRNLTAVKDVPDEGALFYGSVQPGNDLWNATFFCGSCAVIRREALKLTNGFAGETVTEDAHTALKLQRKGWNTAFLNVRLASGLATERLAIHIGQRMRWARGMTQILRIENPLLGPGLKWGQRLCYFNAMMHFQFPLPRIVFLTSPLAYLLFGQNIILASAPMIAAFAAPHLVHSIVTNNRIQGSNRRAFWGEVYETLLAFHLVGPTVFTLFDPKKGKFNVTDKGGLLEKSYFDAKLMWPHLVTVALLIAGVAFGFAKLFVLRSNDISLPTLILNTTWTSFSLLILMTALAVARETKQLRAFVRVDAQIPVRFTFADGLVHQTTTLEASMGGLSAHAPPGVELKGRQLAALSLANGPHMINFPARVVNTDGGVIRVQFQPMPIAKRKHLVAAVMGRADAWQPNNATPSANPLASLVDLVAASASLLGLYRRDRRFVKRETILQSAPIKEAAAAAAAVACIMLFAAGRAHAQPAPATAAAAAPAAAAPGALPTPFQLAAPAAGGDTRQLVITLKDMGVDSPLRLVGVQGEAGLPFQLRKDEVVTAAHLMLNFGYSPSLLPDLSQLTALINDEVIGTARLTADQANGVAVDMPVNPALLLADNRLNLRFAGHYTRGCEDPQHSSLWANVSNTRSALYLTVQRLPPQPDLGKLPAPFFDRGGGALNLPFVFAGNPANGTLQAAAAAASYFGMSASYRGFKFQVTIGALPAGDGVVFALGNDVVPGLTLPEIAGPTLAVVANPNNPSTSLLLVLGRDQTEVRQAAQVLALGARGLSGASAAVSAPSIPVRSPYDAPKWLRMDRPVRLGELVDPAILQAPGFPPAPLSVAFRLAPDVLMWPRAGAPLKLKYRYPDGAWLNRETSRLDVSLNGQYLRSFKLDGQKFTQPLLQTVLRTVTLNDRTVELPPYLLFGQSQLGFYFDLKSHKTGACQDELPTNVHSGVDPDSTIDLTGGHHFTRMPNLAFFAAAGFPFTRMADLGDTAVVMSAQPSAAEIEAFLTLMGRFSDATGAPVTRVSLIRDGATDALGGKDVLVIGPLELASTYAALFANSPVRLENKRLRLQINSVVDRVFSLIGAARERDAREKLNTLLMGSDDFAGIASFRSPLDSRRDVVAVLSSNPERLPKLVARLSDTAQNARVQGDLTIDDGTTFAGYHIGPVYWSGDLPPVERAMWTVSRNPIVLALALAGGALVLASLIFLSLSALERRRLVMGKPE